MTGIDEPLTLADREANTTLRELAREGRVMLRQSVARRSGGTTEPLKVAWADVSSKRDPNATEGFKISEADFAELRAMGLSVQDTPKTEPATGYGTGRYGSGPYGGEQVGIGEIVDGAGNVVGGVDQSGNITGSSLPEPLTHTVTVDAPFNIEFGSTVQSDAPAPVEVSANAELPLPTLSATGTVDQPIAQRVIARLETDHVNLLMLARSLEKLARDEISRLRGANDPEHIRRNETQIELLSILADGFAKIAAALAAFSEAPDQPVFLGKAKTIVDAVSAQIGIWWNKNRSDAVDLAIRIPTFVAAVGTLNMMGGHNILDTAIIGVLAGSKDAVSALKAVAGRK